MGTWKNVSNSNLCKQRNKVTFLKQLTRHVRNLEAVKSVCISFITLPRWNLDREWSPFYGNLKTFEQFKFVQATEVSNISPAVNETCKLSRYLEAVKSISISFAPLPNSNLDREWSPFYRSFKAVMSVCISFTALPRSNLDCEWNPFYGNLKKCEQFKFVQATKRSNISPAVN